MVPTPFRHQAHDLGLLRQAIRSDALRILFEASCGYGKSIVILIIAMGYALAGKRVLVLANRTAVVDQLANRAAGTENITVMTVQSADSRHKYGTLPIFDVILADEIHMGGAGAQYGRVFDASPDALIIGFTGTPTPDLFDVLKVHVEGHGAKWLTDHGFLAPLKYHCPETVDFSKIRTRNGEFDPTELIEVIERSEICGDAIESYREGCIGRPTLLFTVNTKHAEMVRDEFSAAGHHAEILTGKDKRSEVERKIAHIKAGGLLIAIDKVSAGFDLPELHAIISLRPTKSAQLWVQQLGRAARAADGKDFGHVYDHAGNTLRCGTLTEIRNWRERGDVSDDRKTENGERLDHRTCRCCHLAYEASAGNECPFCGNDNGADLRISKRESIRLREQRAEEIEAARAAAAEERRRKGQSVKQRFRMLKSKDRKTTWDQAIASMKQSHAKAVREGDELKTWQTANALAEAGVRV
jgi:superfamily II DNA or RNA helicase